MFSIVFFSKIYSIFFLEFFRKLFDLIIFFFRNFKILRFLSKSRGELSQFFFQARALKPRFHGSGRPGRGQTAFAEAREGIHAYGRPLAATGAAGVR